MATFDEVCRDADISTIAERSISIDEKLSKIIELLSPQIEIAEAEPKHKLEYYQIADWVKDVE